MSDMQAATHLKGLDDKAKLNEKHVKIAQIYKAKVATLNSERVGLQELMMLFQPELGWSVWRSLGRTWIDDGLNWRMLDRLGWGRIAAFLIGRF